MDKDRLNEHLMNLRNEAIDNPYKDFKIMRKKSINKLSGKLSVQGGQGLGVGTLLQNKNMKNMKNIESQKFRHQATIEKKMMQNNTLNHNELAKVGSKISLNSIGDSNLV